MENKVIIDEVDVSGCEFCSATGQCKIQQVFQRNEIVGIIEKPYGVHLECNLCDKDCYYKQLQRAKAELKKYEDMAKKGLEEFKDVGGCWGCGLQLQLNQDMEDIKKLKTENERLKKELKCYKMSFIANLDRTLAERNCDLNEENKKYKQSLQEIRDICKNSYTSTSEYYYKTSDKILQIINEVIGAE